MMTCNVSEEASLILKQIKCIVSTQLLLIIGNHQVSKNFSCKGRARRDHNVSQNTHPLLVVSLAIRRQPQVLGYCIDTIEISFKETCQRSQWHVLQTEMNALEIDVNPSLQVVSGVVLEEIASRPLSPKEDASPVSLTGAKRKIQCLFHGRRKTFKCLSEFDSLFQL